MFSRNRVPSPDPDRGVWTLEVYERPNGSCPYSAFVRNLDSYSQIILNVCLEEVLARQGHEICSTSWGKSLGGGLYEFRVRKSLKSVFRNVGLDVPEGFKAVKEILLRVFFAVEGSRTVLLLSGYDKGKDSSQKRQNREIKVARKLLKELKA